MTSSGLVTQTTIASGEAATIVESSQAGITVPPGDAAAMEDKTVLMDRPPTNSFLYDIASLTSSAAASASNSSEASP